MLSPLWRNGQRVRLLIERLQVRVLLGVLFFTRFSSKSSGRFKSYTESAPVAQLAEHRSYEPKVTVSVLSASVLLIIHVLTSLGFEPRREHAEMV